MKKLIFILLSCAFLNVSFSQPFPINSTIGTQKSTVLTKGIHAIDSAFWLRTNFPDTGTANLGRIDEVPGAIIRVGDKVYMRSYNAIKWIELGSGSADYADSLRRSGLAVQMRKNGSWTTQFNLPDSGGTTPTLQQVLTAGSVLTQDNHITGQNRSLYFDSLLSFQIKSTFSPTLGRSYAQFNQNGIYLTHGTTGTTGSSLLLQKGRVLMNATNSAIDFYPEIGSYSTYISDGLSKTSYFKMYNDSIYFAADKFVLNLPTKGSGKVLTSDANGGASWADLPSSTNYADSLRRSGLTVQMRKGGVWTNQFDLPDSGGGGAYTASNGITLSGSDFKLGGSLANSTTINGNGKQFIIDTTVSFRIASKSGTDMSAVIGYPTSADLIYYNNSQINGRVSADNTGASIKSQESTGNINSAIYAVRSDSSLLFTSKSKKYKIDSLTNSPGTKSLRYNPSTGLVSYGDTISYNQTLQQALTAGSVLTTNNTINYSGNKFILMGDSLTLKNADGDEKIRLVPGLSGVGNDKIYLSNADGWNKGYITSGDEYFETNVGWYIRNTSGGNSVLSVNGAATEQTGPLIEVIQNSNDSIFTVIPNGNIGIGTKLPDSSLHLVGSLKIVNGSEGGGKVLTSDASGGASWKYDTCTLVTFSAGAGLSTDTAAFQTTTIYGSFYNDGSDTLIITKQMAILQGSSPSITPTVYWNDSLNVTAGAVKLVNSPSALTNTSTGASITSFDNYKIPPGVWVWVATPTVGTKPTYFSLSLIGYKKRI